MTARKSDWVEGLWGVLEGEAARREFAYGHCVRLAAECVQAVTGEELLERCELAIAAAAEEGGISLASLEEEVTKLLGSPVPMSLARRGDIVLLDLGENGPALGVCVGDKIACAGAARDRGGVVYLRLDRGIKAWRVG